MADKVLSALVHGESRIGKSTLSITGPAPRLFLDVEKSSRFLDIKRKAWNPLEEAVPEYDGTWDTCVVRVDSWEKVLKAYEYLKTGNHPFKSVVLDSITELQDKAKEFVNGRKAFQTQHWGDLLAKMSFFCRDLRDLLDEDDPNNPLEMIILTALSTEDNGVTRPRLQGQIKSQIGSWFDVIGYLYLTQEADSNGVVTDVRNLLIKKHPSFEAGSRIRHLPEVVRDPNFESLLDVSFNKNTK